MINENSLQLNSDNVIQTGEPNAKNTDAGKVWIK